MRYPATCPALVVRLSVVVGLVAACSLATAQPKSAGGLSPAQEKATADLHAYFRTQTERLRDNCLTDVRTAEDWTIRRQELRQQFFYMLGLDPLPPRGDLQATVTGSVDHEGIVVEKLHFQPSPGFYATANFYRPAQSSRQLPTILYLCGHSRNVIDGVAYGNKVGYQHHGVWFAKNGYCCLIVDTVQLGEFSGEHHGTYSKGMWWWTSRGYTPAGAEGWTAMRALDYLETRPEVDMSRVGVTGRSGGGSYTWYTLALDDRPAAFVPVAGITDYTNHIVDGVIKGHCDCNFFPNIYGFDAASYAALAHPRPLLVANTDSDPIFPEDGVRRVYEKVRRIYALTNDEASVDVLITPGPHLDTPALQVGAFRWFDRWLKEPRGEIRQVPDLPTDAHPLPKPFTPQQLKVFATLPADERTSHLHDSFVPLAQAPGVTTADALEIQQELYRSALAEQVFPTWPDNPPALVPKVTATATHAGLTLTALEYTSDEHLRLPVYLLGGPAKAGDGPMQKPLLVVQVFGQADWDAWRALMAPWFPAILGASAPADAAATAAAEKDRASTQRMLEQFPWTFAVVCPRGIGPTQWDTREKEAIQLRRRFTLLGGTWESGQVWDVRRALAAVQTQPDLGSRPVWLEATGDAAVIGLYAAIHEPAIVRVDLHRLPATHRTGPAFPNVLRVLDVPQAVSLLYPRQVVLYDVSREDFAWAEQAAKLVGPKTLQFRRNAE